MLTINKIIILLLLSHSSWLMAVESRHSKAAQDTSVYSALSMGTGWAISNRHIVTNFHVVADMKNLRLVKSDGTEIPVKLMLSDKNNDIAILSVESDTKLSKPLPLAVNQPRLGTSVFTIGFPHPNLLGTNPKLTTGYVNAMSGLADDPRTYQVSVPIQTGNSGGPLLNMRGEVVGIITSKLNAKKMFDWTGDIPQNVNYAVKINLLNELVSQLETEIPIKLGGTKQDQNFETLAESVIDSIVIVAGDAATAKVHSPDNNTHQPDSLSVETSARHIAVFSYTEPGIYDVQEYMTGSNTIPKFSKNTAQTLKRKLLRELGNDIDIATYSGKSYRDMYVKLETARIGNDLCRRYNAQKLVASTSEINSGYHFRYVSYRIFDCNTSKEFSKMFTIERDEVYDQFGYENGFRSSFKQFIDLVPFFLDWSNS